MAGKPVLMGIDANSKLGPEWIKNEPNPRSTNGSILAGILERYALIVANGA